MSQRAITIGLIVGALAAAWLRFDARAVVLGWGVVLISLSGAVAAWILRARRLPRVQLPGRVQALATRDELTPEEEAEFTGTLQEWHRNQQELAFREIAREGPGPLVLARGALYFLWLSLFVLAVVPPSAVPATFFPELPRFLIVVVPMAVLSLTVAAPLGIRDWRHARKALADRRA